MEFGLYDSPETIKQDVRDHFPERIYALRTASGLSQDAFAKALGVSRTAIGYYENGDRLPDIAFLAALHECTGCSLDYLLGYADTMVDHSRIDIASNYELTDLQMKTLYSAMKSNIFKEMLTFSEFSNFFLDLDEAAFHLGGDELARTLVESLSISALGRLIGAAFTCYSRRERLNGSTYIRDLFIKKFDAAIANRNANNLIQEHAEEIKAEKEKAKEIAEADPLYQLRRSLSRFYRRNEGENDAEP